MKTYPLSLLLILIAACAASENLSGSALDARLSDTVLSFVNLDGPEEALVLELREDGTGVATQTKDRDEVAAVEAITWRVTGDELCLTPPENSQISSDSREECIAVSLDGDTVTLGNGRDFVGTIAPL